MKKKNENDALALILALVYVTLSGLFHDPKHCGHSIMECEKHNENEERQSENDALALALILALVYVTLSGLFHDPKHCGHFKHITPTALQF